MRLITIFILLLILCLDASARSSYRGYSGAPGRQNCASSCHGSGTGSVTISGFPTSYTPGTAYTIRIRKTSGSTISNFNASCRVGTGTTNAGAIAAGTSTSIYNVTGETNGVHFTNANRDSGTFIWTAPAQGTGSVRMYVAALQGSYSGANTRLTLTAEEAAGSLPEAATAPVPATNSTHEAPSLLLAWTAGSGATSHDVYFGSSTPPDSAANVTVTQWDPPGTLQPGTTYYWRITERNGAGVTPGEIWQFTTQALPGAASTPTPADGAVSVAISLAQIGWTAGTEAAGHDVYFGVSNPPPRLAAGQGGTSFTLTAPLLADTVYYWRIDELNSAGVTPGALWHFRTEPASSTPPADRSQPSSLRLGPVYPNPFNALVSISFELPKAEAVRLALYDVNGRLAADIAQGTFAAGVHEIEWSAHEVGSGVYFLRLTTGSQILSTKIVSLK
jgi:hypothetical protein